ncbi:Hypothetical predicted protein [Pelobates cultripes]|uniref:Uncharacterized protein n=1 Tax=Pelobates cultripes TaxID=61616 RepID=A0AAD1RU47_PELCU|nr:Hypothetical predicted protein [Pelobates cultripes]
MDRGGDPGPHLKALTGTPRLKLWSQTEIQDGGRHVRRGRRGDRHPALIPTADNAVPTFEPGKAEKRDHCHLHPQVFEPATMAASWGEGGNPRNDHCYLNGLSLSPARRQTNHTPSLQQSHPRIDSTL